MKLTDADIKFLVNILELFEADSDELLSEEKKLIRENRFTGEKVQVTAVVAKLIDFIYGLSDEMEDGFTFTNPKITRGNCVKHFDRARGIVLKLDAIAYMAILD